IGTNDNSIVSKRSADRVGYFQEEQFLKNVVAKYARRSPLINVAYFARSLIMDYFMSWFLETPMRTANLDIPGWSPSSQPPATDVVDRRVIVLLGCGFDPAYFRIKHRADTPPMLFVDVDFPDLVRRKSGLIKSDPELMALLETANPVFKDNGDISATDYQLVGCDLKQVQNLTEVFQNFGITKQSEILFVSEVALVYMEPEDSDGVLQWAASYPQGQLVMYEQTIPTPAPNAFSSTMLAHFRKMRSPLKVTERYPTIKGQRDRLHQQAWSFTSALSLHDFWDRLLPFAEKQRLLTIEPFDEWEEWHMNGAHYFVIFASMNYP
ncbi:S-adenosyl-L-methionine-dependent methyltransferase, partial [Dimargaris cristalligena]